MRYFFHKVLTEVQRKKKGPKKKERERPVESAANEKIDQGRLRQYFLDDFHNCLENPAGFSTATTGPAAVRSTTELKTNGRSFTQNS
jgi:hypothetical protein